MIHPKGYIFEYKGKRYEGYYSIGTALGHSSGVVQYWLNKTAQDDHFTIKGVRVEIIQKGTFPKGIPKQKYFNRNKVIENEVRIIGNLKLTYSGTTGKLIKSESI
jgi:hypothetical protein